MGGVCADGVDWLWAPTGRLIGPGHNMRASVKQCVNIVKSNAFEPIGILIIRIPQSLNPGKNICAYLLTL